MGERVGKCYIQGSVEEGTGWIHNSRIPISSSPGSQSKAAGGRQHLILIPLMWGCSSGTSQVCLRYFSDMSQVRLRSISGTSRIYGFTIITRLTRSTKITRITGLVQMQNLHSLLYFVSLLLLYFMCIRTMQRHRRHGGWWRLWGSLGPIKMMMMKVTKPVGLIGPN